MESAEMSTCDVLFVEDDPIVRTALSRALTRAGLVVREAATLTDALRALSARPRLLLLDWELPDGTGADVLRAARRVPLNCPAILVSGALSAIPAAELEAFISVHSKPVEIAAVVKDVEARIAELPDD